MERKTKVNAEEGKQEINITREFDLPRDLLFKAYEDAEIVAQWMGTKVVKLESRIHGSYHFVTSNAHGKVLFEASGVIHEFVPNQKITRTFEMGNADLGVQLEYLEFEKLTEDTSRLNIHIIFKSVEQRDQLLKLPFAIGMNMAHDKLEKLLGNLNMSYHEQKK